MSKLNIDQKTISQLFADKKSDFLIPDYQRPYAWEDTECQTLWEDIFTFAFPDNDYSKFNSDNDEYFLGPIVTFKNDSGKMEIIDGQQRLTTLMLLLRAFYEKYGNMKDENSIKTRERLEKCIWKTDEFGTPNKDALKINSEVATDNDKDEFLTILRTGKITDKMKSKYALNYQFFQEKINEFLGAYPGYFSYLPTRILNNCILLPIEAESQDTALRIFSTLNDRGLPLSDADIFKAQFYKYYSSKGEKDAFIKRWKSLEDICEKIFHPIAGTAMDELFTRYMYYERALQKNKSTTTEALRKFYEKNTYSLLKKDETLDNLECLADFWNDVSNQDSDRFSEDILKRLFVLNYAPNGMWNYFVSVYFMHNKDADNMLDEDKFCKFLNKITAFIWAYAFIHPGLSALRAPVFTEMINIIENKDVLFIDYLFNEENVREIFHNYKFGNNRPITKSMITWWAFQDDKQEIPSLETVFEIEHIYAKKRQENEQSLKNSKNLEVLGNKALLEKRINIRASDYRLQDKWKYYVGFVNGKKKKKEGTKILELRKLGEDKSDFTESDITLRDANILNAFVQFLKSNCLLAK
jgi:uncharacterized protein with ParB-like and HNH nuclease domain